MAVPAFFYTMVLGDLRRGESAVVLEVSPRLSRPLAALGIHAGAKITVLGVSPRRQTFLVQADGKTVIAREAAEEVRVWRT